MSPTQTWHDMSFGELLSEGLRRCQTKQKNIGAVEWEIAETLDYSERTIQNWKAGRSLPQWQQLEKLVQYCVTNGKLDRAWVEQLLVAYEANNLNRRYDATKAQALLANFPANPTSQAITIESSGVEQLPAVTEPATAVEFDTIAPRSPYKGLQFFDVADADLFFGREQLTAELVARLHQTSFLAIVGASGSGKSSLVRSGLVASLQRGRIPRSEVTLPKGCETWPIYLITPGKHPLEDLAIALTRDVESITAIRTLIDDLRQDTRSLHLHNSRLLSKGTGTHVVIVVDQFEEIFTLCRDSNEQQTFIDVLLTAALDYDRTIVVIALRADFYANCARFEKLRTALDRHQKYIGPMRRPELQQAIEAPAAQAHWTLEPGLVQQMLDDVNEEAGTLPLLSHALDETWQRRRERQLTLAGYIAAGGVKGAIAHSATALYQTFSLAQQSIARSIFLRLTELGDGGQDTRRRVALTELQFQYADATQVMLVLKALADARLITTDANEVQVTHEAVIREWPLLREWLADNRELLRLQRRLTESANEWQSLAFDEGLLYRGLRLEQTLVWVKDRAGELNDLERRFVEASTLAVEVARKAEEEARQRELNQQRLLAEEEAKRAKLAEERAKEAIEYAQAKELTAKQLRTWRNFLIAASLVALLLALLTGLLSVQSARNATLADSRRVTAVAAQATATAALATAEVNRAMALQQQSIAQARATVAVAAQATAEVSARRANAERLVQHAHTLSASTVLSDTDVALLLARNAVTLTFAKEGYVLPNAELALTEAIQAAQRNQRHKVFEFPTSATTTIIAYSPDGLLLVSAGGDQSIDIWDASNGRLVRQLSGFQSKMNAVAFHPTDQTLASAGADGTIHLWDLTNGREMRAWPGHLSGVTAVVFHSNGEQLVSAGEDGAIRIWDVTTGKAIRQLTGHRGPVKTVAFSPDGKRLASAGVDKTVRFWQGASGQEERQLPDLTEEIWTVAFSPNGQQLVSAGVSTNVIVWSVASGQELHPLYGFDASVRTVVFSPDGKQVLGAGDDGTARIWNVASERAVGQPISHTTSVKSALFSPDGTQAVSLSADGTVHIWEVTARHDIEQLVGHTGSVRFAAYDSAGGRIVSASEDTTIRLWDVRSGQELTRFVGHEDSVRSVMFSPDEQHLVSSSEDGTVRIWNTSSGKEVDKLTGHTGAVWSAKFSPDGQQVVSGSLDTTVRIWDVSSGSEIHQLTGNKDGVWSVVFSPNGRLVASGAADGRVIIWDAVRGQEIHHFEGHGESTWSVAFSSDGRQLIGAGEDTTVTIWDIASGKQVRQLLGHTGGVRSAVFNPNGRQIASTGADKTIRIWDVESGKEVRQLLGHTERVLSVVYSPDGQQIASTSADTTIRLWTASIEQRLAQAQTLIQRNPPILTAEERQQYGVDSH